MLEINQNAPVACSRSISIQASNEKVWSVLTNIPKWTSWNSEVNRVNMTDQIKPDANFQWKSGGANINSTLHTVEYLKSFGWTGKAIGAFAIHNWKLNESNGQTIVTVEESMEGFLVKLFKKAMHRNIEKGMQSWLEQLKSECEK